MRYESKPIQFKLDIDENTPLFLFGDELRIKQILNNILSNAFKYTNEGIVNLTISAVDVSGKKPSHKQEDIFLDTNENEKDVMLVFRISDTGQGMTPEQVNQLGSEYSRFNMEANRKTEGTGLGMNITRNLLRLMNGELHIESTIGIGSVFTVSIPQKVFDNDKIGKQMASNLMQSNLANSVKIRTVQIKREFMPYGRVLVVDDVETNLYVAKGLMAPYGLSIDTAMSGFETIEKIRAGNTYDIIFMDHMMPKMDGIEATKILRDLGYTKPVVALTANALAGQAEMFLKNGFDDFVSKPIDIRQLNIILNKLIRDTMPPEIVAAAREQKEKLQGSGWNHSSVISQLSEFFVRDAKKTVKVLETIHADKCSTEEELSLFIINIHAMKSALANVSEHALSAEASKMEQSGRDKDVKLIMSELPAFIEKLKRLIQKFEEKNETDEKIAKGTPLLLKQKLAQIKTACAEYDKKRAKDMLAELRQKTWSHNVNERLSTIAGCLLHSDFDEAVKIIEECTNQI